MSETRKLAAILVADVVGYSRLAGADEDRILARLRALRSDLIDPTIALHRGRIVKRTGDGSLIEFRSVVDAVRCAVEVQNGMLERNAGLPPDRRIEFRIGIHLGDVVEESDGDLMGDGVNIAARLEGIAQPGAICLSEDAYRQVSGRLDMTVADLGPTQLKNIERPVRVYSLEVGQPALAKPKPPKPALTDWTGPVAAAVVLLAGLAAAGWYGFVRAAMHPIAATHFPAIAVLPFDDLGPDKSLGNLGDGVSEDLIAMLSRFTDLSVTARNSSFVYKGKSVDIRQVGHDLNVDYALEGSVRKEADQIRITAQLVDAKTGEHVWAEHYDKAGNDPSALQDEATERIVRAITGDLGVIKKAQYHDAWAKDAANLSEYDYYLRTTI
jgi:adenylate cyclase